METYDRQRNSVCAGNVLLVPGHADTDACDLCRVGCVHGSRKAAILEVTIDTTTYETWRFSTQRYPTITEHGGLYYAVLALAGEAGEVANQLKKIIRDQHGNLDADSHEKLLEELGDVLWYVSAAAHELSSSLDEIMVLNMQKINARRQIVG